MSHTDIDRIHYSDPQNPFEIADPPWGKMEALGMMNHSRLIGYRYCRCGSGSHGPGPYGSKRPEAWTRSSFVSFSLEAIEERKSARSQYLCSGSILAA